MKTFIAITVSVFLSIIAYAGGNSEKIHEAYANKKGVMSMSFSKDIMNAFDFDFDWQDMVKHLNGDFSKVKVLILDEDGQANYNQEIMNAFYDQGYKEVELEDDEGDDDVIVFADKRKRKFEEIHMLSKGKDGGILISVYGNFEVTDK